MSRKNRKGKKGVSPKQQAANQQNAQLSQGPTSQEGKAISSRNATIHGCYGKKLLLAWEDPEEYRTFYQQLWDFFEPENDLEEQYIDDYIWARWRLRRLDVLEARLYDDLQEADVQELLHQLEKHSRLRMRCERNRDRAYKQFEELRDRTLAIRQEAAHPQRTGPRRPLTNQEIEAVLFSPMPGAGRDATASQPEALPEADTLPDPLLIQYLQALVMEVERRRAENPSSQGLSTPAQTDPMGSFRAPPPAAPEDTF